MLINAAVEQAFRMLGAKRVKVTAEGIATHWLTEAQAKKAQDKFIEMSCRHFGRMPDKVEVFRDNSLWACFVKWPQACVHRN